MADGHDLPVRAPMASGGRLAPIVPTTFEDAQRIAKALHSSGLAPKGIDSENKVLAVIMAGLEVNLPPYQALQSFALINNRPAIWGDAMVAIVRASGFRVAEKLEGDIDNGTAKAICTVTRPDTGEVVERSFSWADAKRAGLAGKDGPWRGYPQRMLQMRARSWALRDAAADVLRGIPMAEEQADVVEAVQVVSDVPAPQATMIEGDGFLKGKAKDQAVAAMTAALEACDTEAELEARWAADEAQRKRLSSNAQYGLSEIYERHKEAIAQAAYQDHVADGDPVLAALNEPRATPKPLAFDSVLSMLNECATMGELAAWGANHATPEALAQRTDQERATLRALYRDVRARCEEPPPHAGPNSVSSEAGALQNATTQSGGAVAPKAPAHSDDDDFPEDRT